MQIMSFWLSIIPSNQPFPLSSYTCRYGRDRLQNIDKSSNQFSVSIVLVASNCSNPFKEKEKEVIGKNSRAMIIYQRNLLFQAVTGHPGDTLHASTCFHRLSNQRPTARRQCNGNLRHSAIFCQVRRILPSSCQDLYPNPILLSAFLRRSVMYLKDHSPYLDSSSFCNKSQNIIRVNLLGNYSTSYYIINFLFTYIPSLLTSLPQYLLSLNPPASIWQMVRAEHQNQKYAYGHGALILLILLANPYR